MKQYAFIIMLLAGLSACSSNSEKNVQDNTVTGVEQVTEKKQNKYGFSHLNSEKIVNDFHMRSFQAIDGKSLIIRSEDRSYLLVLKKVNLGIPKTHHIFIGSHGRLASSSINSGVDKVATTAGFANSSPIGGIYRIADKEQELQIKGQILGADFTRKLPQEHMVRGAENSPKESD